MIIEARNIMYSYKSKRDTLVLKQVSATFEEETFYAIVGPSGSGKTTFLSFWLGSTVQYRETSSIMERISKRRG